MPLVKVFGRDTLYPWTCLPIKSVLSRYSLVLTCVVCLEIEEEKLESQARA